MWCFLDESWSDNKNIAVLAAVLVEENNILPLSRMLFSASSQYLGKEFSKNPNSEIKGKNLLSKKSFAKAQDYPSGLPKHDLAKAILRNKYLQIMAIVIYNDRPNLSPAKPKNLDEPYKNLIHKISRAAKQKNRNAKLVFDQRETAQKNIAVSIANYLGGTQVDNIFPIPLFGSSHATPGIQIADLCAYIIMAKALKERKEFEEWFMLLTSRLWHGMKGISLFNHRKEGYFSQRLEW